MRSVVYLLGCVLALCGVSPVHSLELHEAFEGVPRDNGARKLAAIELFEPHCPELDLRRIPGST